MNAEAREWLSYAEENLQVALLCFESGLYNSSTHNAQQAVEKGLKALSFAYDLPLACTHSAKTLRNLCRAGWDSTISDEECDLFDSVYVPSKYPLGSVLPDYEPDDTLASACVATAERVLKDAAERIG